MRTIGKIVAAAVGVLVLAIVALIATAFFVDWDRFRGFAERQAAKVLSRPVEIGGLAVEPGWTTTVTLTRVRIGNPEWAEGDFATVEELRMQIRVPALLKGDTTLPEVVLRRPVLALVKDKKERVNWDFAPQAETAAEVAKPEERTEFPYVRHLLIDDGRLTYRDDTRGLKLDGKIATVLGGEKGTSGAELGLDGSLEGRPVRLTFRGGSLSYLRELEEPYPFDITLRVGKTEVRAKGSAKEPVRMQGLHADFSLRGPSLADVFPIFGIPMPPTPAYSLEGRLVRENGAWSLRDFAGKIGSSDLSGSVSVDYGPERPFLRANLFSRKLDIADLGQVLGDDKPKKKKEPLLPETPIDRERFKAADLDVHMRAERLMGPSFPPTVLNIRVLLRDGVAHLKPLEVSLEVGGIAGEAVVDTTAQPVYGKLALAIKQVDLKELFRETRFAGQMSGEFNGNVKLEGSGESFAEILGRSRGALFLTIDKGTLSSLIIEVIGLDVAEALAVAVTGDKPIGVRCGRVDAAIQDGVLRLDRALIDTADSILTAGGSVDLGEEMMDVQVEGHAKDFSVLDVSAPIVMRGPLRKPKVRIGGVDPLPFLEMGETRNADCAALLKSAP